MGTNTNVTAVRAGWLPGVTAALAVFLCNGTVVIIALLSLFGISIVEINPHLQAASISLFAALTLVFVLIGHKHHHRIGPLAVCAAGTVVVIGTLYISYSKAVETLGLAALIISALWSWRISRSG